jgi:uncharacterized protein
MHMTTIAPPFTLESATQMVRLAEDGWNSRDPKKVSLAYTPDSHWRNRAEFVDGRAAIVAFLTRKWAKELDYRLIKELWAFGSNRIGVRYAYEWHDDSGNWFRSYGNENWEYSAAGLMQQRFSSINDLPIKETDRKFHWPLGQVTASTAVSFDYRLFANPGFNGDRGPINIFASLDFRRRQQKLVQSSR